MGTTNLEFGIGLKKNDEKAAEAYFRGIGMSAGDAAAAVKKLQDTTNDAGKRIGEGLVRAAAEAGRFAKAVESGSVASEKQLVKVNLRLEQLREDIAAARAAGSPIPPDTAKELERIEGLTAKYTVQLANARRVQEETRREMGDATRAAGGLGGGINSLSDVLGMVSPKFEAGALSLGLYAGAAYAVKAATDQLFSALHQMVDALRLPDDIHRPVDEYISKLDRMRSGMGAVTEMARDMVIALMKPDFGKVGGGSSSIGGLDLDAARTKMALDELDKQSEAIDTRMRSLERDGHLTGDALKDLGEQATRVVAAYNALGRQAPPVLQGLANEVTITAQLNKNREAAVAALEKERAAQERAAKEAKRNADELQRLTHGYGELMDMTKKKDPLAGTFDVMSAGQQILDQTHAAIVQQAQDLGALETALDLAIEKFGEGSDEANKIAVAVQKARDAAKDLAGTDLHITGPYAGRPSTGTVMGDAKRQYDEAAADIKAQSVKLLNDARTTAKDRLRIEQETDDAMLNLHREYAAQTKATISQLYDDLLSIAGDLGMFDTTHVKGLPDSAQDNRGAGRGKAFSAAGQIYQNPYNVKAWWDLFNGIAQALTTRGGIHGYTEISASGGRAGTSDLMGIGSDMTEHMKGISDSIGKALNDLLSSIDGTLDAFNVKVYQKGQGWRVQVNDGFTYWFDDLEKAVNFAIMEGIKGASISGLDPEVKAALEHSSAKTFEDLLSDLQFAKSIADIDLSPVAAALKEKTRELSETIGREIQLGIDPAKTLANFARSVQEGKNQLLGIQMDPAEKLKADVAAYNQEADLVKAQAQLTQAKALSDRASLQAQIANARAELSVDGARLKGHAAMVRAEGDLVSAEMGVLQQLLAGVAAADAAILAAQAIIDSVTKITDEELADALRRLGSVKKGGGLGGDNPLDKLKDMLRDLALQAMPPLARQIADINAKWDEEIKLLGKNEDAIKKANDARKREIELALQQAKQQADADLNSFLDGDMVGGIRRIQEQAANLRKEYKDLKKQGGITGDALRIVLQQIGERARELQKQTLTSAADSLLLQLYDYLGMDKEAAQMKHDLAVAELLAKRAELQAALEMANLDPVARTAIEDLIKRLDGLIPKVVNDPNFGTGGKGGDTGGPTASGQAYLDEMQNRQKLNDELLKEIQQLHELAKQVEDFRKSLRLDANLTTLTPEQRLAEARAQFQAIAQQALASGGRDQDAVKQAMDVAKTFAEISRSFFASGSGYTADFNWIDSVMAQLQALLNAPHFAEGGVVSRPTFALIGERGPEVVIPIGASSAWQRSQAERAAADTMPTAGGDDAVLLEIRATRAEMAALRRSFDELADAMKLEMSRRPITWGTKR